MIVVRKLELVDVDSLIFDPDNPNIMTQEQMTGLRGSMQRFGFLVPIIIDQNNKIADGEHRVVEAKAHGLKKIPAFRVELATDADRRLLRQVMNKLHGTHDKVKDAKEFRVLIENGLKEELKELTTVNDKQIEDILRSADRIEGVEDNTEIEEPLPTEHECPKCGYKW